MIQRISSSHRKSTGKYLLLTGATGFVGRYLLRDLLLAGHRVAVVVRPFRKQDPRQRIEMVMQHWEKEAGRSLPRPIVMTGDVRQTLLGLSAADWDWVRNSCDRIVHAAAVLNFFGDRQSEPWVTNVDGTKNVLALCEHFKVNEFHFLSTAYVCGQRNGTIGEQELDQGQAFRNDYEHSKFVAEKIVREQCKARSVTVYRPAVVVGDSKTGATSSYQGLFLYLRLLATLVPKQQRNADGAHYTPIHLPLRGDEPRNLVPVDWVSQVICTLIGTPAAHGKTIHLAPDVRTTPRSIVDSCYEYFHSCGVEYDGHNSHVNGHESEFAKAFFANTKIYQDYDRSDPDFDRSNLRRFCPNIPCPEIDQAMIRRFLDFGYNDQWGRAKHEPIKAGVDVEAALASISPPDWANAMSGKSLELALDVHGPGGGQWTLSQNESGGYSVVRGIPTTATHLLQLNSSDLCPTKASGNGAPWLGRATDAASYADSSDAMTPK